MINKDKITMTFNKNVSNELQKVIMGLWGVTTVRQSEKYLGLLTFVGKSRRRAFGETKQSVWKKL